VRQFTPHVRFLSVVGDEPWVDALLREQVGPAQDLVLREPTYTSIIKERFVEPRREGQELNKLFAVNYLDPAPPDEPLLGRFETRLIEGMAGCDAVLLLDFGHGLMVPRLRGLVQERAPFLALNCQTNSNNHGFNVLSRQYRRADAFTLDEQELMLVAGRREVDFGAELAALRQGLGARYAWLTRGPVETIGLAEGEPACLCPPLETEIVDTVGAGDAFFTVASLAAAGGLPVDLGTFLGQLAGAQAVRIVGNAQPISKETLVKAGMSLLNF
jgi:bifunctional ADP-heptose synthase (sugar kinase/adenylyltransferase)